jgi:glycosyltransferase involved in cell wall biosynthesis
MATPKSKVCLLLNMIAPSRLPLYSALADHFDLLVLHGRTEAARNGWQNVEKRLSNARVVRAWGWEIRMPRKDHGKVIERREVHITPGFLWHLLRFRPDLIITNEMGFRTIVALAYGTLLRTPVWVWWGGTRHTEREIGRMRKTVRWILANWAQHWITYGRSSTEYLLSLGIRREKILESQNAVDEQRFAGDARPMFQIQPRPVLLCVGQLIARKGIELLFHAAAGLQGQGHEFSLLLVGRGPDEQALKNLAEDFGLKDVYFRDEQPAEKMASVYRSADALVFPTIEDIWGLVANEAILSGLPVLCSTYAGCAAELFPPENIFDPANPEEFREKLRATVERRIAGPDPARLRKTRQIASELIDALERSMHGSSGLLQTESRGDALSKAD